MKIVDYFKTYKHFIFSGHGGTGKTTLSASWALEAVQAGYRVCLITIDPSRRLGAEFGMDINQDTSVRKTYGDKYIDVHLVQSKQIIKDFILDKYSADFYENILKNKLFNKVSTTLSENQSVSTIYKLSELIKSPDYDIIIVDTPPASHTADFFRSPKQVIKLFQDNLLARAALDTKGLKFFSPKAVFSKVLTYLTGADFVQEMEGFFGALFSFQSHIVEAATELEDLLKSDEVCYFLVTSPAPLKILESVTILKDMRAQGIRTQNIIVNRAYPQWLQLDGRIEELANQETDFSVYYDKLWGYYNHQQSAVEETLKNYDKGLDMYFLPEVSFFSKNYDIGIVQQIMREYIQ